MKKYLFVMAVLFASFAANAATRAATQIDLNGGVLTPGGRMSVKFAPLYENVAYQIQCTISAPEKTIVNMSIQGKMGFEMVTAKLNDQWIGPLIGSVNGIINAGENKLELPSYGVSAGMSQQSSLDFLNLDRDISITVSNCTATPAIQ